MRLKYEPVSEPLHISLKLKPGWKVRKRHRVSEAGVEHQKRKVDVRLPGKGDSNSHGARPVHLIITMIKWIRTRRLSIKISLSRRKVRKLHRVSEAGVEHQERREFFIDTLLVRIHFIIVMIRWTGLASWEFEFPFPGTQAASRFGSCRGTSKCRYHHPDHEP